MTAASRRVAVVGGGVVGVLCAYELLRAGAEVTLLERSTCGASASWGNAGWVVPSLSAPPGGPHVLRTAVRSAFGRTAPLRLASVPGPATLRWIRLLVRNASAERYRRDLAAAVNVATGTHVAFDRITEEFGVSLHRFGLLAVARTDEPVRDFVEAQEAVRAAGYDADASLVDGATVRRLEPALSGSVTGGVHLRGERSVDPAALVAGALEQFRAAGGEVREHTPVRALAASHGGWRVTVPEGDLAVESVVVAAGAWSSAVLAGFGVRLPLQPARGCSLTSMGSGTPPTRPMKLLEAQVACSPMDNGVRLSGTYDLTRPTARLSRRRLRAVLDAARPYFDSWKPDTAGVAWSGLRPATPDGLPAVGPLPGYRGMFVATGHGTLGVTLAPVTARAITDMVVADRVPDAFAACGVDRFTKARVR